MEEAEAKIKRETPPGVLTGQPSKALRMGPLIQDEHRLGCGGLREQRGQCACHLHPPQGQGEDPREGRRPTEGHPCDSDPFFTCSDGDGRDRRHSWSRRRRRQQHPSRIGRRGTPTPIPELGGHPLPTPGACTPMG